MPPVRKERNVNLDLMRFIGVLIIMIAHAQPPLWLDQLRNFGTPLLIMGSALTYGYIYENKLVDTVPFWIKRMKRLIIPAWTFLTFFFIAFLVVSLFWGSSYPFTLGTIVKSYSFYSGIGFVWILKVYIFLALITPLGLKFSKSEISNAKYFALLVMAYLGYELLLYLFYESIPGSIRKFVSTVFLVLIPYAVVYLYGLRAHLLSNRTLLLLSASSLLIFSGLAYLKFGQSGVFVETQRFKYPPRFYYLTYAFFGINLVYYLISRKLKLEKGWFRDLVIWLSTNSFWIYLWHIMGIYIWRDLFNEPDYNANLAFLPFFFKAIALLSFGVVMTYLQSNLVSHFLPRCSETTQNYLVYLK